MIVNSQNKNQQTRQNLINSGLREIPQLVLQCAISFSEISPSTQSSHHIFRPLVNDDKIARYIRRF
jgi:hypothetical protein